jgi:hypothetical protein
MKLDPPPADIARAGLRALKAVVLADGELHDLERGFLEAVQSHVLKTDFDVASLEPIDGKELAALVPAGQYRERILRACVMAALIDTEASPAELALIEDFAGAFGIESKPVEELKRIIDGRLALLRYDLARRSFVGKRFQQHLAQKGLRGLAQAIAAFAGFENKAIATKYRALKGYPAGSLGRGYYEFIEENGFAMPGEKGGAPEPIVFHDCVHVLGEYDTTPEEEVQVVAFEAGFQKYDPFFTMLGVVAQFHLGLRLSPVADANKFGVDPDKLIRAMMRGTKVTRDLSIDWNPWDDFEAPLSELRKRYNILPRD